MSFSASFPSHNPMAFEAVFTFRWKALHDRQYLGFSSKKKLSLNTTKSLIQHNSVVNRTGLDYMKLDKNTIISYKLKPFIENKVNS